MIRLSLIATAWLTLFSMGHLSQAADPPAALTRWLQPQTWTKDVDAPVISLGKKNAFDETGSHTLHETSS
jgi:hypothetical protein